MHLVLTIESTQIYSTCQGDAHTFLKWLTVNTSKTEVRHSVSNCSLLGPSMVIEQQLLQYTHL